MIYFIQAETSLFIKIGYTGGEADGRLKALQTGNPEPLTVLGTMLGDQDAERAMHTRFAHARMVGEWFRPVPELVRFIVESCSPPPLPVLARPDRPLTWPLSIYLAGKITGDDWRAPLLGPSALVDEPEETGLDGYGLCDADSAPLACFTRRGWPLRRGCVLGEHHYTGPYRLDVKADCTCGASGSHGGCQCGSWSCEGYRRPTGPVEDSHGCAVDETGGGHGADGSVNVGMHLATHEEIVGAVQQAVFASDLVFAWINRLDCYGTIVELGLARRWDKHVCIASPYRLRDLWLLYHLHDGRDDSSRSRVVTANTPENGLRQAIDWLVRTKKTIPSMSCPYPIGAAVQHDLYGTGTVVEVSGTGPLLTARVHFASRGEKSFRVSQAKLRLQGASS